MSEEIILGGGHVATSALEELPEPSFIFTSVFTDNVLDASEVVNPQQVTAQVSNMEGQTFSFDLFNSGSAGTAVASKGGTVGVGETEISAIFSPAELAMLTDPNCRIDLVFPELPATRPVGFSNTAITVPNTPQMAPGHGVAGFPGQIPIIWQSRPGDALNVTAENQANLGVFINLPAVYVTSTDTYNFTVTDAEFVDGTYTIRVVATGADLQTAETTSILTVARSATASALTSPVSPTSGSVQTVSWTPGTPAIHSAWILAYTDPADPGSSDFFSQQVVGSNSVEITNIPTSGTYYIEHTAIPDDGSGNPDWPNIVKTTSEFQTVAVPHFTNIGENQLLPDPFDLLFTSMNFTADSLSIKLGRAAGASDLGNFTGISMAADTQNISGYDGEADVYIQICSVTGVTETLHEQIRVTAAVPTVTGYHNNIGTVTDSSAFAYPSGQSGWSQGRIRRYGATDITIENFKIDNVTATQDHYEGGISLDNCHNITIRNGYIKMPEDWLHKKYNGGSRDGERIIYGAITMYQCTNITIENVNVSNGQTNLRIDDCRDITIRNVLSYNCWNHHLQMNKPREANGHRFTVENFYGYRTNGPRVGSSTDSMNFSQFEKSGSLRASVSNALLEDGNGATGSGFIVEGPGSSKEIGAVDFTDIGIINGYNKAYSHGGGNDCTYTRILGYQNQSPYGDIIDGKGHGTLCAYSADFRETRISNLKDINFGNDVHTDCRVHWVKEGVVEGFEEVYESNDQGLRKAYGDTEGVYYTPVGNAPTFINCQYDADREYWPPASGNPMSAQGSKNWATPCVTELEIRNKHEASLTMIPCFTGFGQGSMANYNRAHS